MRSPKHFSGTFFRSLRDLLLQLAEQWADYFSGNTISDEERLAVSALLASSIELAPDQQTRSIFTRLALVLSVPSDVSPEERQAVSALLGINV